MGDRYPIPSRDDFFEPTIKALKALGGSGTNQEIYEKVCELEGYSEEQQSIPHIGGLENEILIGSDGQGLH